MSNGGDFSYAESISTANIGVDNLHTVARFGSGAWEKVSHDLLKYMMECGKCTAHCAQKSQDAFNGCGWERTRKVKNVADTVYFEVERKWLCDKNTAQLAKNWVNLNLNARLQAYTLYPTEQPKPIGYQPGVIATPVGTGVTWVKENIPDMPSLPSLPSLPTLPTLPSLPSLGIAKYVFLFILIIIGLIALGYSGVGGIMEREHERRRK